MRRIVKVCEKAGFPAKKALLSWLNDAAHRKDRRIRRLLTNPGQNEKILPAVRGFAFRRGDIFFATI
ncbi:hypothetical protein CFI03_030065 [Paenibacillus sp. ATY16]|nr:hypothetical protein [Paenibacillus sp. ATY16]